MEPLRFEGVTPILRVADVQASLAWYSEVLGFSVAWQEPRFACITRNQASLFLAERQGIAGNWVWIGVSDVEALYEALSPRYGDAIRQSPQNYPWALEMHVFDPDRNVLRLGSEPKPDRPWGEWLDMDGVRWTKDGDDWKRVGQQATPV